MIAVLWTTSSTRALQVTIVLTRDKSEILSAAHLATTEMQLVLIPTTIAGPAQKAASASKAPTTQLLVTQVMHVLQSPPRSTLASLRLTAPPDHQKRFHAQQASTVPAIARSST